MKHSSDLVLEADVNVIVPALSDLSTYPFWNDLVSSATPSPAAEGDPGPAWLTTLRAQVGPFARSKQLRFARDDSQAQAVEDDTHHLRFVRREIDGRNHASWEMHAIVSPRPAETTSTVTLTLQYDGNLWIPALGTVLGGAIERATERLPAYLESRTS